MGEMFLTQSDIAFIFSGLYMTLMITLWTVFFAIPLGIIIGIMRTSQIRFFKWSATIYIETIRSVPLTLYMILIFLVFSLGSEFKGILTLSSFTAAYIAEIFRAGLNSLDQNQIRAAHSLGMSKYQVLLYISIPQALRKMIPALVNQFNVVIKDTSLVSIGLLELTKVGKLLSERKTSFSLEIITITAIIYFVICYGVSLLGNYLERRYSEKGQR